MKYGFFVCLVVFLVFTCGVQAVNCVSSDRTNSWLDRAKDAGNPSQVAEFLAEYKKALYTDGKVEGKYTSVFHYPGTYMPTYLRAVDGLIQRAKDLEKQNPTDTSYQMGLVNLEKDLGDIKGTAYSVWVADIGWLIWAIAVCGILGMLVFGCMWSQELYTKAL